MEARYKHLVFHVTAAPGANTFKLIGEVTDTARHLSVPVEVTHNGVVIRANPSDRNDQVLKRYQEARKKTDPDDLKIEVWGRDRNV